MFPDADEPGMSVPAGFTNLVGTGTLTFEDIERAVQRIKDMPNIPPKIDIYHPEQAARLRAFELSRSIPVTFPLRLPEDRGRLREESLLPWCIPLHEESEAERIRRSLAFYSVPPLPLPSHLWLLTDPPAPAPPMRLLRIKLRLLPVYLQQELRRRKRRRNHAP